MASFFQTIHDSKQKIKKNATSVTILPSGQAARTSRIGFVFSTNRPLEQKIAKIDTSVTSLPHASNIGFVLSPRRRP
jgi:hypothetical protein